MGKGKIRRFVIEVRKIGFSTRGRSDDNIGDGVCGCRVDVIGSICSNVIDGDGSYTVDVRLVRGVFDRVDRVDEWVCVCVDGS